MIKSALLILLYCSGLVYAGESKTQAIFAASFTNITDTSARCVFTTAVAGKATVAVSLNDHILQTMTEPVAAAIHHAELDGLESHKKYKVTVTIDLADPVSLLLTTGLQRMRLDRFEGTTYFGIAHVDDIEALKKLGAGLVRYSPTWDVLEPTSGGPNPVAVKKMVDDIAGFKAAGVEPLVLLCFSTDWSKHYTKAQMTWRHPAFGPPDSIEQWKNYVRLVMTSLKGSVRYYEIWNEPDAGYLAGGAAIERTGQLAGKSSGNIYQKNDDYWLGDRYVPLAEAARQVADEVDGDKIDLLGPGWNHDYHGTRGKICFDRGLQNYLQMYSFHNYVGDPHSYALWEQATNNQYMVSADALFKKFNAPMPIAVTEWGVRTYDDVPSSSRGFHTRRDGQIFLAKSVFDYLAMQRVSMLVLHQMGYNDEWSLLDKRADGTLVYHPMFDTYRWLCHTFGSKKYESLLVSVDAGPTVRAFAIRLIDSGEVYIALWQNPQLQPSGMVPVLQTTARIKLSGLRDGRYAMEKLDVVGKPISSNSIDSHVGYSWSEVLSKAGLDVESEPLIYRLIPDKHP